MISSTRKLIGNVSSKSKAASGSQTTEINPYVDQWVGVCVYVYCAEYGGLGLDFSYSIAVSEELGNIRCGGIPMAIGVQTDMATPALARFGSEELKKEFLLPSITGDKVACLGVSEVGAGSDVAICGECFFTVTMRDNIIQDTIQYTRQRKIFKMSVLYHQSVHVRLAELETEIELLHSLLYRSTALYIKGNDVTKLASMAKLKAGHLSREVGDSCLQYWGGMGFSSDVLVSRFYRGARLLSIGGGADEVMLSIICKYMDTLPKAPDKN
uniref:Zgc:85777 n=1 Tax=Oncorhynchus mykiss TaxID=8022 RepID=A0A8K9VEF8_ONCMY